MCLLMEINRLLPIEELIHRLHYISDTHIRQKRRVQNKQDASVSETFSRDVIRKEIQLALGSRACKIHCPKEPGDDEAGLVAQASMVRQGPKDHRGPLDLGAIRALKDPRAILVNPSQLLQLSHPRFPWWLTKLV